MAKWASGMSLDVLAALVERRMDRLRAAMTGKESAVIGREHKTAGGAVTNRRTITQKPEC